MSCNHPLLNTTGIHSVSQPVASLSGYCSQLFSQIPHINNITFRVLQFTFIEKVNIKENNLNNTCSCYIDTIDAVDTTKILQERKVILMLAQRKHSLFASFFYPTKKRGQRVRYRRMAPCYVFLMTAEIFAGPPWVAYSPRSYLQLLLSLHHSIG